MTHWIYRRLSQKSTIEIWFVVEHLLIDWLIVAGRQKKINSVVSSYLKVPIYSYTIYIFQCYFTRQIQTELIGKLEETKKKLIEMHSTLLELKYRLW